MTNVSINAETGELSVDEDPDPYSTVMVAMKSLLDYGINNSGMSTTEQGALVNVRDRVLDQDPDLFR